MPDFVQPDQPQPQPQPPPPPAPFSAPGPAAAFYPLTIGRVVSLAFSMFRFGWKTYVAINLVVAIPVALATSLLTLATYQQMDAWQNLLLSSSNSTTIDPAPLIQTFPWGVALTSLVLSLVLGMLTIIANAALIHAVAATFAGGRASVREAYRFALGLLRDLFTLYVVLAVAGLGLTLLVLFVPLLAVAGASLLGGGGLLSFLALMLIVGVVFVTFFLLIRFVFAVQVMVVEGLPALPSLRRTYTLVAGSLLRVIGYAFVFGLILGLIGLVISFISLIAGLLISPADLTSLTPTFSPASTFAQALITNLLAEVFAPILTIGFVLLYFDTRYRHGETVPTPGGGQATAPAVLAQR